MTNNTKKEPRILKRILKIIIALIIISTVSFIYYAQILDRGSKPLTKEDMNYIIKTEQFFRRNVFVVSPKDGDISDKTILYLHRWSIC